ncbi:RNA polymerase subunit sigma [Streptomyces sp. NPDC058914]|uniref:RNA polymerase subunit sigma n=1 Tax=Streptomyces TaxID=1883 RepID=UPI003689A2DE
MDHADAVPIAELLDERRYLLDVASRMLGSTGEAEWVVDETYRRWYGLPDAARAGITSPRSWLTRTAERICLAGLARPGRGDMAPAGPGDDSLRAAVADGAPQAPARHSLRAQRSCPTTPRQHDAVARAVHEACVAQDGALLASLLCPDVTAFFDGGGKVRAAAGPVQGSRQVARSLLTLLACRPRTGLAARSVNGRTGLLVRYDDQVAAVISLDVAEHHVAQVWAVLNPDKLRAWNPPTNRTPGSGTPCDCLSAARTRCWEA